MPATQLGGALQRVAHWVWLVPVSQLNGKPDELLLEDELLDELELLDVLLLEDELELLDEDELELLDEVLLAGLPDELDEPEDAPSPPGEAPQPNK